MHISEIVEHSHQNAVNKGFYDQPREFGTAIALMHSELSEALEAHRQREFDHIAEEFADCIIRIADTCGHMGIDLETAIAEKMAKNEGRPYKHGKAY